MGAPAGTFAGGLSTLPSMINLGELGSMLTSISCLKLVTPVAISIMIIALVETLLAGKVVDELTGGEHKADYDVPTRSVIGMSAGNFASALFGGFGGCGLIPQTVLNIKSGGGGKWSSASYAAAMAAFIVFFAPLVGQIPEAALAGVMLTVGADTVTWGESANSVKRILKPDDFKDKAGNAVRRSTRAMELLILWGTSYVCYFGNLAVGIIGGILAQMALLKANDARLKA